MNITPTSHTNKTPLLAFFLVVVLMGLILFGLTLGPADIGLGEALRWVGQGITGELDPTSTRGSIVWLWRLPRLILAALVGASLALAGVVMQGVFRNPMADPFLVGVSSGAALGATLAIFIGGWWHTLNPSIPLFSFMGAIGVSGLVYGLAYQSGRVAVLNLLLVGIALGALCQGIVALLLRLSPSTDVQLVFFWLMGSLTMVEGWGEVQLLLPYTLLGFLWLLGWSRSLDLLQLGEEEAAALGLSVERTKLMLMGVAAILAAASVCVSGIVGFVGLMIPHMVRLAVGANHRRLLVLCAPAGAVLLVASDLLAGHLVEEEIPIGIITAWLGVPFFLFLLRRKKVYRFS